MPTLRFLHTLQWGLSNYLVEIPGVFASFCRDLLQAPKLFQKDANFVFLSHFAVSSFERLGRNNRCLWNFFFLVCWKRRMYSKRVLACDCWSPIGFMICYCEWLICFLKEDLIFFAALSIDLWCDLEEWRDVALFQAEVRIQYIFHFINYRISTIFCSSYKWFFCKVLVSIRTVNIL